MFRFLLCILCFASVSLAANRVALVVGNGSYPGSTLPNPPNDADLISSSLTRAGFKVIVKKNLTRDGMLTAACEFSDALGKEDTGLFFFAGHGAQAKGENYLIPVDAPLGMKEFEAESRAVKASTITAAMEESGCSLNVVVLDCCRNNPFARSWRSATTGLAEMKAPKETLIAYATAPGQEAADGDGKNSPYTAALAEELLRPGAKLEEVFKRVAQRVHTATNGSQRPWMSLDVLGEFVFLPGNGVAIAPQPLPAPSMPSVTSTGGKRTLKVPGEYAKIQDAINAAGERDRVEVGAGIYEENLEVGKGIELVGAGKDSCIVRYDGRVDSPLDILGAKGTRVTGFCFEQIGISTESIRQNLVTIGGRSESIEIFGCRLRSGVGTGILVADSSSAIVTGCDVSGCAWAGIDVKGDGTRAELIDCRCSKTGGGIAVREKAKATIKGCELSGCARDGIAVSGEGTRGEVINCRSIESEDSGIYVGDQADATVQNSTFANNLKWGGCVVDASPHLMNNQCTGSGFGGICVRGRSSKPRLIGNRCNNNNSGIVIETISYPAEFKDNTATGNKREPQIERSATWKE